MAPVATRVVDVQRQVRWTLAFAAAFALAAPVAAIIPHSTGSWLPLHLFLVGSLVCAISGATQLLAVTWSTAPAPASRMATLQRCAVVGAAATIAVGRELDLDVLVILGAVLLVTALVVLALILFTVRRRSGTDRFHPAIDTYLVAIGWATLGTVLGATLATTSPSWWEKLRSAHLVINLLGFVGLVIVGTLPFFVATQARTKMSKAATPRRIRAIVAFLSGCTALTAIGCLVGSEWMSALGFGCYGLGLVALLFVLPRLARKQLDWAGPRLLQLGAGWLWWFTSCELLAVGALTGTPAPSPVLRALVVGGFAQILAASLAYFAPVLRGGGHGRLTSGFAVTRSWPGLAAANLAAAGLLFNATVLAGVAIGTWLIDAVIRTAVLTGGTSDVPHDPESTG